jgi:hypothetical protein
MNCHHTQRGVSNGAFLLAFLCRPEGLVCVMMTHSALFPHSTRARLSKPACCLLLSTARLAARMSLIQGIRGAVLSVSVSRKPICLTILKPTSSQCCPSLLATVAFPHASTLSNHAVSHKSRFFEDTASERKRPAHAEARPQDEGSPRCSHT